jgi:hypothetical protein
MNNTLTLIRIMDTLKPTSAQSGKGAFNNPAMLSQVDTLINLMASKSGSDTSFHQTRSTLVAVTDFIRMQLFRAISELSFGFGQERYSINHLQKHRKYPIHWRRCALLRVGFLFGRPQYGASSPICRDPLDSDLFFRPPGQVHCHNRCLLETSRSGLLWTIAPTWLDGAVAINQLFANPAIVSNKSSRCHIPFQVTASPIRFLSLVRTGYP